MTIECLAWCRGLAPHYRPSRAALLIAATEMRRGTATANNYYLIRR